MERDLQELLSVGQVVIVIAAQLVLANFGISITFFWCYTSKCA